MSHIIFYTKPPGQRSAGKPHAALDAAGAGNVAMVAGLRAVAKAAELPPEPKVRAPVLDPTGEKKRKRLAKYIYPGPAGFVMMSSPSIDLPRAHHESEPNQKRGQSPALV